MTHLRELTNPGESMNYLLDNGYTEDARRLFEAQFTTGATMQKLGVALNSVEPYAVTVGYNNSADAVDPWLWRYFHDTDAEVMQAEYRDAADTTAGLLRF